ncbi:phospholipase D-like domain-containing protein [Phycisphaera mikurensis]|uniref:Cardiolipin synthase n=1 Tax=Phycisphaera mikurensis (strain NBRC 102666 / KCTC 22515 / FYK2301M01) TaxID=1142394 RepID=I0IHV1_PHYMF|nr:phospholipase D-like domain-containing protein [Phycisphaera mikurensis]MBB6441080.1 cardiolipin synthase [Phycisphaera mikurensis]BAM04839.1 cardiolipin synthase [Phycisphaera mikurensis NBRC 102666]
MPFLPPDATPWWATAILLADVVLRLGTCVRILMRRHDVELSLAWLVVVLVFPFAGSAAYWLLGEIRIGRRAALRSLDPHADTEAYLRGLRERAGAPGIGDALDRRFTPLAVQAERATGVPALPGNRLKLLPRTGAAFKRLAGAIDRARSRVEMVYYIFMDGPASVPVMDALVAAARRGVACRVLVDALGSRSFLRKSPQVERLRAAGVELVAALPSNPWRMLIRRVDLRNHRKLAVIDQEIAFTGSMNLVGPRRLKKAAEVGPWVDCMVEVAGPAVGPLHAVFLEDWKAEKQPMPALLEGHRLPWEPLRERRERPRTRGVSVAGEGRPRSPQARDRIDDPPGYDPHAEPERGTSWVQVVPSGPHLTGQSIRELLLTAVYAARRRVVLTTPYFIPDEAVLVALTSAAARGVEVALVVPEVLDSALAQAAGEAHLGDLLEAGVGVHLYRGGLLHTKSVTVDGDLSIIGTVNLDARSFYLNFELSLLVYDPAFTRELVTLQEEYVARSLPLSMEAWEARSFPRRLIRNGARLVGPLL